MGWRFRKSFKVIPGVRINVSKSGISTTVGGGPFSVNIGPRGIYGNANIPGTGISYRQRLDAGPSPRLGPAPGASSYQPQMPTPAPPPILPEPDKQEIRSASTYELTSEALKSFSTLLMTAAHEQRQIDAELASAARDANEKTGKYQRWARGFVFKHIMKQQFAELAQQAEESAEKVKELQEQRRLTTVATVIEIVPDIRPAFGRLCDSLSRLSTSARIWDTLSSRRANRVVERTAASETIERTPVAFRLGQSDLMSCEWRVPHLENANGGDLFLYPGFVLYRVSAESFALVDCRDVNISCGYTKFIEEEAVPPDSQVVGSAWKYSNKNGSPDRRFTNNYQIPVVQYASLIITSPTGLNEQYLISNAVAAEQFASAWQAFRAVFTSGTGAQQASQGAGQGANNELFRQTIQLVTDLGRISSAMLQQRLNLTKEHADKILLLLEQDGCVGPAEGSKPRRVLQKAYQYREWIAQGMQGNVPPTT